MVLYGKEYVVLKRITNAYFAAYITSFVRAVLGEIMNSIPADKTVFSCTTDGFLSTINDEESVAATKGHLCQLYKQQREILSGSSQVLEIKHQVKTPLGWRTRGQATLDASDVVVIGWTPLRRDVCPFNECLEYNVSRLIG